MTDKPRYINAGGKLLALESSLIMGILNITPDSFYKGSRYKKDEEIISAAGRMLMEGADIIDVGGYSSRPGAEEVSRQEEAKRVLTTIRLITKEFPEAIISIDTFRSDIAKEAVLGSGAHIINDISGGDADSRMFPIIEKLNVPYIMMHMKGDPSNMQSNPVYEDVVAEILRWFGERIFRLQSAGVRDIIIDPGFGFGKTTSHNFQILQQLNDFSIAGLPVLVGLSRKSMIWKSLNITPDDALNGTTVLNTIALLNGADILRVHDIKEAVQMRDLLTRLRNSKKKIQ